MANDERRWKLFVANRVSRGYPLYTLLANILWWPGPRWLDEEEDAWPELDINSILGQTETERVGRTSLLSITTSLRRNRRTSWTQDATATLRKFCVSTYFDNFLPTTRKQAPTMLRL
ncbi:hypothetical protein T02_16349 [Trichinella nativa]|uniref:Uncharacterized protein n=1 Tax=Trichinella nativa TaxID=6335 RepID=A0A0V1LET4_9BILA|nr:hypothetical protein T06_4076 [Trichinella sp. T6]KRZ58029.1 hypothetical protein T02_16349 [Trichinella nativa]